MKKRKFFKEENMLSTEQRRDEIVAILHTKGKIKETGEDGYEI